MKIRYYGHVGQSTGYGRAASDLCMALLEAGVELEIRPLSKPRDRVFEERFLPLATCVRADAQLSKAPDAVIVHTTPVDVAAVRRIVADEPLLRIHDSIPWIAYTTWESHTRPVELRAMLDGFHQTWHPSRANAEALGPHTKILPHCFDPRTLAYRATERHRTRANPERYAFYFIGAWSDRKAPHELVDTYLDTFHSNELVHLFIHAPGADTVIVDKAIDRVVATRGAGTITISHGHVADAEVGRMHGTYDCFVTASKGEAWNLPAFDAMLAGRHVIAPLGQGSDDYLGETDASLYGTVKGALWNEAHLGQLRTAMREAFTERHRDLCIPYDRVSRYGYAAVARQAISYIEETRFS